MPADGVLDLEHGHGRPPRGGRDGGSDLGAGLICGTQPQGHALLRAVQPGLDVDTARVQVGGDDAVPKIGLPHSFEPDRLPDAGGARVDTAITLEPVGLLARRLQARGGMVRGADDELVLAIRHQVGDLEREGGVTALMLAGEEAVHPHSRVPVHGAEVEEQSLPPHGVRDLEHPTVPHTVHEVGHLHTGESALGAEGNEDLAGVVAPEGVAHLLADFVIVDLELPHPVQVEPVGSLEVGSWVFGPRDVLTQG